MRESIIDVLLGLGVIIILFIIMALIALVVTHIAAVWCFIKIAIIISLNLLFLRFIGNFVRTNFIEGR